jgi:hypothetical protein
MDRRRRVPREEAVFFFRDGEIVREMRYEDFRNHLINGRPVAPFAGETVEGAYVAIGDGLAVQAVCCFTIAFDQFGVPEADWNVPVRELAFNSGDGPDLGAGPIRLACRGQCSIPWHNDRLWQPEGAGRGHPLVRLQQAVRRTAHASATSAPAPDGKAPAGTPADPLARTMEMPALNVAAAASRFDATFGREGRVSPAQLDASRAQHETVKQLRESHAAEVARLKAKYERQVIRLQAEVQRLRRELTNRA